MELYSWGVKIFSEEVEKQQRNFEYTFEVSSLLIEMGVEQKIWKMVSLGKNLLASVLSFSEDMKDIEYAILLFEEIRFGMERNMPDLYFKLYHQKAVNKKLKLLMQ